MKQRLLAVIGAALLGGLGCRDDAQSPSELPPAAPEAALVTTATPLAFLQLSAGSFYTCGVASDHRAYCWGDNANGQLGIGTLWEPEFCHETSTCSRFPIAVVGGLTFRQVASGDGHHACGITTDSVAYCWGPGNWGQLGDGTLDDHYDPTRVATPLRFRQVSVGVVHSCAVTSDDRAYCWGQGNLVGDGSTASTPRKRPVAVAGGLSFKQVSADGNHTCGLTTSSRVYCWGGNGHGQMGDGSGVGAQAKPVRVHTGLRFRQLDTGFNYTCAVTVVYRDICWGVNDDGQLGDGTKTTRLLPRAVAGGVSFERVTAGFNFTCGETTTNRAYCWGSNFSGQLGDGTRTLRLKPTPVAGGLFFRQLSAGGVHTCGRASTDLAYCWGLNSEGELGDGTYTDRLRPTAVAGPQ
jgi:alpha-tubulin suppressor-like RCC1 family protein